MQVFRIVRDQEWIREIPDKMKKKIKNARFSIFSNPLDHKFRIRKRIIIYSAKTSGEKYASSRRKYTENSINVLFQLCCDESFVSPRRDEFSPYFSEQSEILVPTRWLSPTRWQSLLLTQWELRKFPPRKMRRCRPWGQSTFKSNLGAKSVKDIYWWNVYLLIKKIFFCRNSLKSTLF